MSAESAAIAVEDDERWACLGEPRWRLLTASWAGIFRGQLLAHLPVESFAPQFTKCGGRPRKDLRLMLGVLTLQQLHDLTDAETVEAVAFHLAWHYALGLPPSGPIYLCERTLRNYRRAVIAQGLEEPLFQRLTDELIRAFGVETESQRIDSTVVCSAMRVLTRAGILVETISQCLRELKRRYPTLHASVEPEILRVFVERRGEGCFGLGKPSEIQHRLPEAATILGALVQQFAPPAAAQLGSYQLLPQVFTEQCEWRPDERASIRVKSPTEIPSDSVQNPADPDASSNTPRGCGYGVQVMEPYAEDDEAAGRDLPEAPVPDVMTPIAVHKLTQHDIHAISPAVADVRSRGCGPTHLLGDSHYGSRETVTELEADGIELLAPAMPPKGYKHGQLTLEQFTLDGAGRITTCPAGHRPIWMSVSPTRCEVRFDPSQYDTCPLQEKCPSGPPFRAGKTPRWQYTPERVTQRNRRLAAQQPAFKAHYRWRAGIEATMSRLKHQMQLAHLRVRGMAAVRYGVFLRALGLNLWRVAALPNAARPQES